MSRFLGLGAFLEAIAQELTEGLRAVCQEGGSDRVAGLAQHVFERGLELLFLRLCTVAADLDFRHGLGDLCQLFQVLDLRLTLLLRQLSFCLLHLDLCLDEALNQVRNDLAADTFDERQDVTEDFRDLADRVLDVDLESLDAGHVLDLNVLQIDVVFHDVCPFQKAGFRRRLFLSCTFLIPITGPGIEILDLDCRHFKITSRALLPNLGSTQFLFRARSGTNYVVPVAGNVTVADEEVLYDNVYPSIESGNLQVTMASGLLLLDASSAVLVDPATALAYAAAGGGGSGGLTDTELRATPVPIISGATRQVSTATIASGTSLSTLIDLHGTALLAFITPAAWDTAAISLEVSSDNVLWATEMYDTASTSALLILTMAAQ